MTTLSDSVAALEAERDQLRNQVESQRRQIAKQIGALEESRGENNEKRKEISRLQAKCNSYESYFRALHHGLTDLKSQAGNAKEVMPGAKPSHVAAVAGAGSRNGLKPQSSLSDRIARLVSKSNGVAA